MEKFGSRIPDGKKSDPGSVINPGSATLIYRLTFGWLKSEGNG
jgi:hypothetical protein